MRYQDAQTNAAGGQSLLTDVLCVNNLKSLREKHGYSLQELADLCGRSKAQMWELEKISANPTLKTAYAIATVLCVDVTTIWPNTTKIVEETITVRRVVHNAQVQAAGGGVLPTVAPVTES